MVDAYNHSHHRILGRRPIDVNKQNETEVWLHLYEKLEAGRKKKDCFPSG